VKNKEPDKDKTAKKGNERFYQSLTEFEYFAYKKNLYRCEMPFEIKK
jgi:hypothetical protein